MQRSRTRLWLVGTIMLSIAASLSAGCGAGSGAVAVVDTTAGDAIGLDQTGANLDTTGGDVKPGETTGETVQSDVAGDDASDTQEDNVQNLCSGPGEFLCDCEDNSDCVSGYCVETATGKVCSSFCVEDCAQGWECVQDVTALPDSVYICLPRDVYFCRPCNQDSECRSPYVSGNDLCVAHGNDGSFCGLACNNDSDCPANAVCAEVTTAAGATSNQCFPVGGECACSKLATELGAWTSCSQVSDFGTCDGTRVCAPTGLTQCDARVPSAEECNGIDDNCDGVTDPPDSLMCVSWYVDNDGDGYGIGIGDCLCGDKPSPKHTSLGGDCDDSNVGKHPGAVEVCNYADDNCNGQIDEAGSLGCKTLYYDSDGDGYGNSFIPACLCFETAEYKLTGGDCDDTDAAIGPGEPELCDNEDNDCDGEVDEVGAIGCMPYYLDQDGDGYGLSEQLKCLCEPWAGYTATKGGDCNDADITIHPTVPEVCDGADNDCDGEIDEGEAANGCPLVAHGSVACLGGCVITACDTGYFDLNAAYMDGCECQKEASEVPNQTCSSATDLGTFADSGSSSTMTAKIVPVDDSDWFKFTAVDDTDPLGCDTFHLRVRFLKNPNNAYWFKVYRGSCTEASNLCTETTDFEYRTDFSEENRPDGAEGYGECPCKLDANDGAVWPEGHSTPDNFLDDTSEGVHQCSSQTSIFYIQVTRVPGATLICDEYQLEVTNGAGL